MMSRPKIRIKKYSSCIEQRAEEKNWRLLLLSRYKNPLTSHVRTHFFFSLLIRNNYVRYLLLKYSTSPLANRHEICPKKITSPGFWNARITIFSEKIMQPAKILVSTVPKNFMQNKLWFLFNCSKMRLKIYFSSHHLHQWYGSFLTAPFVWFKQTFLPKTLLVWCYNK